MKMRKLLMAAAVALTVSPALAEDKHTPRPGDEIAFNAYCLEFESHITHYEQAARLQFKDANARFLQAYNSGECKYGELTAGKVVHIIGEVYYKPYDVWFRAVLAEHHGRFVYTVIQRDMDGG